ncbi:MAG: beta-propeller domain-containing protein [Candidatus Bathyarchaeota archaeon]|nr:MAG: beta-propeller domain-containing protein [Candidatus Bathyarchaeota archaeon]
MNFRNLGIRSFFGGKKILATALIAFMSGLLIGGILLNIVQVPPLTVAGQPLLRFSSYEELVSFVNTSSQTYYPYEFDERGQVTFSLDAGNSPSAISDYSTTNIQVVGVDEADVVKTDGEHLYVVSNQTVYIVKADSADLRILSQINLNGTVNGIFINGDKLVVFWSNNHQTLRGGDALPFADQMPYWLVALPKTYIGVFDVSNRLSPISTRNITLDGSYFNSRMIGSYVYALVIEPAWLNETNVKLPSIYSNGQLREISATDIYYSNTTDYGYTFTTIIAVNIQNDVEMPNVKTIMVGATRNMYVSLNNIYITLPRRFNVSNAESTLIYRIQVEDNDITIAADGEVPGRILNQFSMDEFGDHFRIATTTGSLWSGGSSNHVFCLNMSLDVVGRLEGLAEGESIYSARFLGTKFYLVTFRKVDPLFVIDLQNPEDPYVLGELKVTGYSDYLHPYDDTHLIGVGKETVAADEGDFSWYQGVKISLFDVSDPVKPVELDKTEIGDRGTDSPVLRDHKAFLFDKERQLLAIPVLVADIDETKYLGEPPANAYGDFVWQGVYVYQITLEGLELKGTITHIEDGADLQSSYYYYSPYSVSRTLYIDNELYTLSEKKIMINSLDTLIEIGQIELP